MSRFFKQLRHAISDEYSGKSLETISGVIDIISNKVFSDFLKNVESGKKEVQEDQNTPILDLDQLESTNHALLEEMKNAVSEVFKQERKMRKTKNTIIQILILLAGGVIGVLFQNLYETFIN